MRRIRVIVAGRVQGVFFRQSTFEMACSLKLSGYVRNLKTGEVEVEAEGDEVAIEKLIEWLKVGPPLARVTNIKIEELSPSFKTSDFKILY